MKPESSVLARAIEWLVERVCRRSAMTLAVCAFVAVVSVAAYVTKIEYRTQRTDLESPDKDYLKRWREYVTEFGDEDDMVVVVRGSDAGEMRRAIDELAKTAANYPDLFDRIFARVDLSTLKDRALLYLPPDQLHSIRENLDRMGPLLSAPIGPIAWRSLTLTNLLRQARERAGRLDPDAQLAPADEQFLKQLTATVRSANATLRDPKAYRNPWDSLMPNDPARNTSLLDEPRYFFSGDGGMAFLLIHPVKAEASFAPAEAGVATLRRLIDETRPKYPDLVFGLTGLPVLETDEMTASQRDSALAGWLALAGAALLYALVYRGFRYPLLTVSTLLLGTAWAMGWMTLTVGHLNILSAAFAVMIIGLGDYGVLWVTHYEQRRTSGESPEAATRATAGHIGPSIAVAGLTTALAFFAAMLADFRAVAELGWIAGCGVLLCALSCFTWLPALIRLTDRRGLLAPLAVIDAEGVSQPVYAPTSKPAMWLPSLARRPRYVLAASIGLLVVAVGYAGRVRYDHNLLNMQAEGLESVRWERELIDATAGASWHAVSHTATPQEALSLKARYETLPGVSRVVEVASLVPSDQDVKLPLVTDIRKRLTHLPANGQAISPMTSPVREVQKEAALLLGALQPLAPISRHALLEDLVRGLTELRDHPTFRSGESARDVLRQFETRMAGDLVADLHRLRAVATPRAINVSDLPVCLRERFIGAHGRWLVQAYARENLWEIEPLDRFVNEVRSVDPDATGKPFGTLEGLLAMQSGFCRAGLYALFVIVVVLAVDCRTLRHTAVALVPLGVGFVLLLGIMGLAGRSLNPANMIALPLIVGCGVDNGVHVIHDYRRRRRGPYALARSTGKGICVSALTTVLGFGSLIISQHRGLSGLGFALALGVTTCMLAALVLLPAILRLTGERRRKPREASKGVAA